MSRASGFDRISQAGVFLLLLGGGCTGEQPQTNLSTVPTWTMDRVGVVAAAPAADPAQQAIEDFSRCAGEPGLAHGLGAGASAGLSYIEFTGRTAGLGLILFPLGAISVVAAAAEGTFGPPLDDEAKELHAAMFKAQQEFFGVRTQHQGLADALVTESKTYEGFNLTRLEDTAPPDASLQASASGVDTLAEIAASWRVCPANVGSGDFVFQLRGTVRLSTTDGSGDLAVRKWGVRRGPFDFVEWGKDDARKLREALEDMQAQMARELFREVFYTYRRPSPPEVKSVPPSAAAGIDGMAVPFAGFRPVQPQYRVTSRSKSTQGTEQYWVARPTVDSLTPLLVWEPFPGTFQKDPYSDPRPFVDTAGQVVEGVAYDLEIECEPGFSPRPATTGTEYQARLFRYSRDGLTNTSHRIESPLPPKTKCRWRTRARFVMDGRERVTGWSRSLVPIGLPWNMDSIILADEPFAYLRWTQFYTPDS